MSRSPFQGSAHRAFCLKIHESRRAGWRVEQRFDRLFEALEIASRFLEFDAASLVAEVGPVLKGVNPPLRVAALDREDLQTAIAGLRERILPKLETDLKERGYHPTKIEWMDHHRYFFISALRKLDHGLAQTDVDARHLECGEGLLRFCTVLRSCRHRAYPATVGGVVGFPALLGPLCDALDGLVIAVASRAFEVESAVLERTIGAITRGSMVRLEFDPFRGGFSLEFPDFRGEEHHHQIENMFTVVTHGHMVTRVFSRWGSGGIPVANMMGPAVPPTVEGQAPLEQGYLRKGTIILELTKERLSMWFADPVLEPVVEYSYPKLQMRYWLGREKQVGGWPVPTVKESVGPAPVQPFAAFDIPLHKIPMVGRLDGLSVYAVDLG